eukprot:Gb_31991 [translate_table: standard]
MSAARKNVKVANRFCPEIVAAVGCKSDEVVSNQVFDLALAAKSSLNAMVDEKVLFEAMSKYPQAPLSDLVFISKSMHAKVCKIFDAAEGNIEYECKTRECSKIDYKALGNGDLEEVRFVFAKIVVDTLYSNYGIG